MLIVDALATPARGRLEIPSAGNDGRIELCWDSGSIKLSQGLEIHKFDLSGRPISVTRKDGIFRRGLDGRVVRILRHYQGEEKFHSCQTVEGQERRALLESVVWKLERLRPRLGSDFRWLEPALDINLEKDSKIFGELYGQVGILPPDCYGALLLNLTQGCSYNKCSFCSFFKEKSYSLRNPGQFKAHIEQAKRAFGPSIASRRGIFLGQANAANAPTPHLEYALASIAEEFPCKLSDRNGERRHPLGFERVSSFMDTFSQLQRTVSDWHRLHAMGLKALYLGVESGSSKILKLLNKPGHPRFIKDLVDILKVVAMEVNVIVMTGVGGKEMSEEHVVKTVELLNALPLSAGDRIYLSAFQADPNSKYARMAQECGLTEMSQLECRQQTRAIRNKLIFDPFPQGPAVTLYDIQQFIY